MVVEHERGVLILLVGPTLGGILKVIMNKKAMGIWTSGGLKGTGLGIERGGFHDESGDQRKEDPFI
jgi:hypothetical protein